MESSTRRIDTYIQIHLKKKMSDDNCLVGLADGIDFFLDFPKTYFRSLSERNRLNLVGQVFIKRGHVFSLMINLQAHAMYCGIEQFIMIIGPLLSM